MYVYVLAVLGIGLAGGNGDKGIRCPTRTIVMKKIDQVYVPQKEDKIVNMEYFYEELEDCKENTKRVQQRLEEVRSRAEAKRVAGMLATDIDEMRNTAVVIVSATRHNVKARCLLAGAPVASGLLPTVQDKRHILMLETVLRKFSLPKTYVMLTVKAAPGPTTDSQTNPAPVELYSSGRYLGTDQGRPLSGYADVGEVAYVLALSSIQVQTDDEETPNVCYVPASPLLFDPNFKKQVLLEISTLRLILLRLGQRVKQLLDYLNEVKGGNFGKRKEKAVELRMLTLRKWNALAYSFTEESTSAFGTKDLQKMKMIGDLGSEVERALRVTERGVEVNAETLGYAAEGHSLVPEMPRVTVQALEREDYFLHVELKYVERESPVLELFRLGPILEGGKFIKARYVLWDGSAARSYDSRPQFSGCWSPQKRICESVTGESNDQCGEALWTGRTASLLERCGSDPTEVMDGEIRLTQLQCPRKEGTTKSDTLVYSNRVGEATIQCGEGSESAFSLAKGVSEAVLGSNCKLRSDFVVKWWNKLTKEKYVSRGNLQSLRELGGSGIGWGNFNIKNLTENMSGTTWPDLVGVILGGTSLLLMTVFAVVNIFLARRRRRRGGRERIELELVPQDDPIVPSTRNRYNAVRQASPPSTTRRARTRALVAYRTSDGRTVNI